MNNLTTNELIKSYPNEWEALRSFGNLSRLVDKIKVELGISNNILDFLKKESSYMLVSNLYDINSLINYIFKTDGADLASVNLIWEIRRELMKEAFKL